MAAAKHVHGKEIQLSRRTAGFETQAEFAVAVDRHTVSVAKWESGTTYPGPEARVRIRHVTGLDLTTTPTRADHVTLPDNQVAHTGRAGAGETPGRQEGTTMHDPLGGLRERYELIPKKRRIAALAAAEAIFDSFLKGVATGLRVAKRKRG